VVRAEIGKIHGRKGEFTGKLEFQVLFRKIGIS
jgi:hypothetical protein